MLLKLFNMPLYNSQRSGKLAAVERSLDREGNRGTGCVAFAI